MAAREVRILHVITRLDRGGSALSTLQTAAGLSPRFRQRLVYGRTREFPRLDPELLRHLDLVELPQLVREPAPVKDLVALVKLYRLIRGSRVDLVHTHTSKAGILGRLAARLAGVRRVVHTPHGHYFVGGYAGRALTRLFVRLERWAARFTDRIVGLTEQEIRDHVARGIGRPEQFVVIPSGVALPAFEKTAGDARGLRAALGLPGSATVVGSVGRFEPVKGHHYLLEAVARLARRCPDLHVAFVGDGELLPELRRAAEHAGLAGRAHFLGWREDVPAVLHTFDLFVLPSLNEGMGRALVEAMAAGLPIVASEVGGVPEVLAGGAAGVLVPPADAGALARAIETLLGDPALRARLGAAARDRAGQYTAEASLRKLEALYDELLGFGGDGG